MSTEPQQDGTLSEPASGVHRRPPAAPDALKALYGARGKRSKAKDATAKSLISPGERPQEIYTPESIVDAMLKVWPYVALDPCFGPGSIVPAEEAYYIPPRYEISYRKNKKTGEVKQIIKTVFKAGEDELDGLVEPWRDYTYCNPPFMNLRAWLNKACEEGQAGNEIMLLCPTRGNRKWFRKAKKIVKECGGRFLELDPLKFLGYASAFPAPLCIFYFGAAGSVFEQAFLHLGDCT